MGGAVPGAAVVIKRVIRGEVDAATEPPGADALAVVCGEKADIGMAGRDVGVARVDDQRQAMRGVGAIREFGAMCETLTPPCSKTAPSCSTIVSPCPRRRG